LPDGGEYAIFTRLATEAPEFDWRVYGAYGTAPLDGYAVGAIEGTDLIGAAMRASSVGYHSKHWSDGFGHVVHNWFAVGRPVLGRALLDMGVDVRFMSFNERTDLPEPFGSRTALIGRPTGWLSANAARTKLEHIMDGSLFEDSWTPEAGLLMGDVGSLIESRV